MKNWILTAAMLIANICQADPVDVETARAIATQFLNGHSIKARSGKTTSTRMMRLVKTMQSTNNKQALFYVFNNGEEDGGYVVTAADDVARPILAYSESGTFDWNSTSCCERHIMESYAKEIETALSQPERYAEARQARQEAEAIEASENSEATGPRKAYRQVQALMKSKWDQGTPYNTLCPIDPSTNKRSITGCVATAAAQLMYYHKWPQQGQGSHSYEWRGKTLSADFGSTTYQWDKMKNVYKNNPSDPDNAVATLMFHCGVACDMNYSSNVSYASISASQFIEYFRYSPRAKDLNLNSCGRKEFERIMHQELEAGRPIVFRGADANDNGGHVFICDGCTSGSLFHFNLGWTGEKDGYYSLSALDTEWYELSFFQFMIYGLQPPSQTLTDASGNQYELIDNNRLAIVKMNTSSQFTVPTSATIDGITYPITEVGAHAFLQDQNLRELTIPAGITAISNGAFVSCTNLEKVVIEDSDTPLLIGRDIFYDCGIATLYMGRNITTDQSCFHYLPLTSVTLGAQVTMLPELAFAGSYITSITLPANLEFIAGGAFANTFELEQINIAPDNTHLTMKGNALINTDTKALVHIIPTESESYTIPHGLEILQYSCMWPSFVKELHIPSTVTTIGNWFMLDPNLKKVYLYTRTPATCYDWTWSGLMSESGDYPFTIYVPRGSLSTYKRTKVWNTLPLSEWDIPTDVDNIEAESTVSTTYFHMDGTRLTAPRKGINILRRNDGNSKKVLIKQNINKSYVSN